MVPQRISPLAGDLAQAIKVLLLDQKFWNDLDDVRNAAAIRKNSDRRPRIPLKLALDLSTAQDVNKPYIVSSPFDAFQVDGTLSSSGASASLIFGDGNTTVDSVTLSPNVSGKFDRAVKGARIWWGAQAGKTLVVTFFLGLEFSPGNIVTALSGSVAISEGTAATLAGVTMSAAAATQIALTNNNRKVLTLYNDTGGPIYIGVDNTVTNTSPTKGMTVAAGATFVWKNTAALWGYSVAGGTLETLEET